MMFEKEAEQYRNDLKSTFLLSEPQLDLACQGFKDGAEFGYNKANEWHDLRKNPDDLPEEGAEVLNDDGVKVVRIKGHWRYVYGDTWEDDAHLDHWCEVPKFEVE